MTLLTIQKIAQFKRTRVLILMMSLFVLPGCLPVFGDSYYFNEATSELNPIVENVVVADAGSALLVYGSGFTGASQALIDFRSNGQQSSTQLAVNVISDSELKLSLQENLVIDQGLASVTIQ